MPPIDKPTPAILIAGPRTGGTFLSVALSNHPQIFCARGEPFHWQSSWRVLAPDKTKQQLLWSQWGYTVSMFKITEIYFKGGFIEVIKDRPEVRILFLSREDALEQAASEQINRLYRRGLLGSHPTHSFEEANPVPTALDVAMVARRYRGLIGSKNGVRHTLARLNNPILHLTYEQITSGGEISQLPEEESQGICKFLGVRPLPLQSHLRKIHKRPYSETVTNWHEIVEAVS